MRPSSTPTRRRGARSSSRSSICWRSLPIKPSKTSCRCHRLQGRVSLHAPCSAMPAADAFQATAERYRRQGFTDFKVKLSGDLERDLEKIVAVSAMGFGSAAGSGWTRTISGTSADEAIRFLRALDYPLFAVEEPIQPNQYAELASIGEALDCQIVLDESFLRIGQLAHARRLDSGTGSSTCASRRWAACCDRCRFVDAGRGLGIGVIVGAQVGETSLLTRAGADRRRRRPRAARRPGRRVRHVPAGARRLRSAADVRRRRRARCLELSVADRAWLDGHHVDDSHVGFALLHTSVRLQRTSHGPAKAGHYVR